MMQQRQQQQKLQHKMVQNMWLKMEQQNKLLPTVIDPNFVVDFASVLIIHYKSMFFCWNRNTVISLRVPIF